MPDNFVPTSFLKQLASLPPLNENKTNEIFNVLKSLNSKLGIVSKGVHVGYGSDGNNLADLPVQILVGLGPYGGGMHTVNEFMVAKSFAERSKLNVALIKRIIEIKIKNNKS